MRAEVLQHARLALQHCERFAEVAFLELIIGHDVLDHPLLQDVQHRFFLSEHQHLVDVHADLVHDADQLQLLGFLEKVEEGVGVDEVFLLVDDILFLGTADVVEAFGVELPQFGFLSGCHCLSAEKQL